MMSLSTLCVGSFNLPSLHVLMFFMVIVGLSVIRSFQQQERFFSLCCDRVDHMNRCHLYLWLCNRWLNVRMQVMGSVIAGLVAYGVVTQAHSLNGTTAGLALVYSLQFTDYLTYLGKFT